MVAVGSFALVGREEELARLQQFVHDVADGPSGMVVRAAAGMGKTVLWRAAIEAAEKAGIRVLVARCVEAEMPLALGGLSNLVDPALAEVGDELPRPQRDALAVAIGLEAPSEERPARIALPRAFRAYLHALARRGPVLVAVDDLQWLDPPSLRILAFAARRLADAPVGILLTQRGDTADPLDLVPSLDGRVGEIRLGPLSIGALHRLVRSRLGIRIPRPTLARVHSASGGNPMFALEFSRSVADRGTAAAGPLPVPSSLEELVGDRVASYPPRLRDLLAVVAAVERPTLSLLEAAIDGAGPLLDQAFGLDAITIDDGLVQFAHPLLASAVYAAVPPMARRRLHARLAAVSDDLEQRARHLALSRLEPSAAAAKLLDEAAARARAAARPIQQRNSRTRRFA